MSAPNLLSIAGVGYDIVGAILLAQAIVRTRHETLVRQARHGGQFSGGNLPLFAALEEQRHDARFGLAFLVGGFLLQLITAFGSALAIDWGWSLFFGLVLVLGLTWWRMLAKRLSRSRRMRFANSLEGMDRLNFLSHNPLANQNLEQ